MATKKYGTAELVEELATKLIAPYHPELATARIKYIWIETAGMKSGRPVLGKVRKVSGAFEYLLELDFMVEIALDKYNELTPTQRTALVDHLLERCYGEENEKDGTMAWKVREPDVQEFASILQRHGAWNEELNGFVSIAQRVKIDDLVAEVVSSVAEETVGDGAPAV
jgi:hypothetical protein